MNTETQAGDAPRDATSLARLAREFFDREPPQGYIREWSERLASPENLAEPDLRSVLIFRLGAEWLALGTDSLVEVTVPQPVHTIPFRSNKSLLGLVNVRGQLRLCVSLHEILGVETESPARAGAAPADAVPRMVIIQSGNDQWVFQAEEVVRVHRISSGRLRKVPSTFPAETSHTQAVFDWSGRTVGYLDDHRLLRSLRSLYE